MAGSIEEESEPLKPFDICRQIFSLCILGLSIASVAYGILNGSTLIPEGVPQIVSFIALVVALFLLGTMEGLQIALVEMSGHNPQFVRAKYPRAALLIELGSKNRGVERFLIGRQVLVVVNVFVLARITTFEEWFVPIPRGVSIAFFHSGFIGVVLVVIVAQLTPQILAAEFPVQFLNSPLMWYAYYLTLAVESTGIAHATWTFVYLWANHVRPFLLKLRKIEDDHGRRLLSHDESESYATFKEIEMDPTTSDKILVRSSSRLIEDDDEYTSVLKECYGDVNKLSEHQELLEEALNLDTYPDPEDCRQKFIENGLKPPRFLLPVSNPQHLPPHIVAMKLLEVYTRQN